MNKKSVILFVLVIIIVGGAIGYYMWNKEPEKIEDVDVAAISIEELTNAYETDETAANEKHLNKALKVTGTVSGTETNQDGKLLVILTGDNTTSEVQCTMRDAEDKADEGAKVTVKGFCSGSNMFGVLLTDCVIVE